MADFGRYDAGRQKRIHAAMLVQYGNDMSRAWQSVGRVVVHERNIAHKRCIKVLYRKKAYCCPC